MVQGDFLWEYDHCAGFAGRFWPMEDDGTACCRSGGTDADTGAATSSNPDSDTYSNAATATTTAKTKASQN
ncbi:hypothetical protein SCT_2984 [Sulfuricella sp. T08]|nr:hypothetical protein SCT_2984 [Sulfuricella sp. T08]